VGWRSSLRDSERVQRGDETIPAAWNRFDESRVFRRVAQGQANFLDGRVQALVEFNERAGRPNGPMQFLTGNQLARAADQQLQNSKRLFLELDPAALLAQLSGSEVQFESPEPDDVLRLRL
jgi:hypothetical protein